MKNPAWNFTSTGGSYDDGPKNAMIEHFEGNHSYHLAREIIQNAIDAKRGDSVNVVFQLEYHNNDTFPGYKDLKEVISKSKIFWAHNEEAIELLAKAQSCLNQKAIPFLKISDYNTKGLNGGDHDRTGRWYNLVRSRGSSPKSGGEGGSFGIGKGAPFASSPLRVVFYSSRSVETPDEIAFQGVAELVSFELDGDVKRGTGIFGINNSSIRSSQQIPPGFVRKEIGTDIFIAGYEDETGWENDLIQSILRNFWYAIYRQELTVQVGSKSISHETLEIHLAQFFLKEKTKDHIEPIGNPLQYYLTVKHGKLFQKELRIIGHVSFYFREIEDPLNYVAMMRKSHMIVCAWRFMFPGNFAGVFICENDIGNKELRKMEPPAHDKWDIKRNNLNGSTIEQEIRRFIRECLNSEKNSNEKKRLDIPLLSRYLPYEGDDDLLGGEGNIEYTGRETDEDTSRRIQERIALERSVKISPYKVGVLNSPDDNEEWVEPNGDDFEGGIENTGENGEGRGGNGDTDRIVAKAQFHARAFVIGHHENKTEYMLVTRVQKTGVFNIKLFAVGEERAEKLNILEASDPQTEFDVSDGMIRNVALGQNAHKMKVSLSGSSKYALRVELYEIQ